MYDAWGEKNMSKLFHHPIDHFTWWTGKKISVKNKLLLSWWFLCMVNGNETTTANTSRSTDTQKKKNNGSDADRLKKFSVLCDFTNSGSVTFFHSILNSHYSECQHSGQCKRNKATNLVCMCCVYGCMCREMARKRQRCPWFWEMNFYLFVCKIDSDIWSERQQQKNTYKYISRLLVHCAASVRMSDTSQSEAENVKIFY